MPAVPDAKIALVPSNAKPTNNAVSNADPHSHTNFKAHLPDMRQDGARENTKPELSSGKPATITVDKPSGVLDAALLVRKAKSGKKTVAAKLVELLAQDKKPEPQGQTQEVDKKSSEEPGHAPTDKKILPIALAKTLMSGVSTPNPMIFTALPRIAGKPPSLDTITRLKIPEAGGEMPVVHKTNLSVSLVPVPEMLKVSSPQVPVKAETINSQLSHALAKLTVPDAGDATHVNVVLSPETLGKIAIKIEHGVAGEANITIQANQPATLETLKRDLPALNHLLTNAGISESNRKIDFQPMPVAATQISSGLGADFSNDPKRGGSGTMFANTLSNTTNTPQHFTEAVKYLKVDSRLGVDVIA